MDKTTVLVDFSIYADSFNPEEITNILAIEPTEIRVKGEIPNGRVRPSIETVWTISTAYEESHDINIQLAKITSQLEDKVSLLQEIKSRLNVNFTFIIVTYIRNGETPAIIFSESTLKFMSDIGASIDMDTYA